MYISACETYRQLVFGADPLVELERPDEAQDREDVDDDAAQSEDKRADRHVADDEYDEAGDPEPLLGESEQCESSINQALPARSPAKPAGTQDHPDSPGSSRR